VLVADANGAYRIDGEPGALDDARRLEELDDGDLRLACLEQPLATDDLLGHAELARRLDTPICLDESLTTPALTQQALDLGACSVVCVKAPRYGSWLAAADVLDHCLGTGVDAWVGGMLDTGLGRLANIALAAHPGATLPGDISATARFFTDDVTAPVVLDGSEIAVPALPGIGASIDLEALDRLTVSVERVAP
jgi:O-succinylbenzoate synthase